MNMKKIFPLAVASLVATQVPLLSVEKSLAQSATTPESFECLIQGNYATVAIKKDGSISDPIIVWTTEEFSQSGYTPQRRCEEVTNRLNSALSQNGGTLRGLYITAGRVNGLPVLCSVNNTQSGCNGNNVLFTLKRENDPNRVLRNLSQVSGSGNPLQESDEEQLYVNLETLVNQLF